MVNCGFFLMVLLQGLSTYSSIMCKIVHPMTKAMAMAPITDCVKLIC